MPPPGGSAALSTTRCNHFAGIEDLKVAARTILWNVGIDYGPNRINRLCKTYPRARFGAARDRGIDA